MIKRLLEDVRFAAGIMGAIIYLFLLDMAYQIRFCGYRGEIIITYTKAQRILSLSFYPLLFIGIALVGLFFYGQYLDVVRRRKSYKHLHEH